MTARYVVGIDLGTTNSAVAFVDMAAKRRGVGRFAVPQLVAEGTVAERATLASAVYLAGEHDVPASALALPWSEDRREVVGEFARVQGGRVPARLVTSAKSWLTHAGVDRSAKILPWGAPEDVPRISPVGASARILGHIRAAWDAQHPDAPLADQQVILTIPASFDEVARELTVDAAKQAGLAALTLLEEPQAAFYAWLAAHERQWETLLGGERSVLVVDVGGGTTDLTLIAAKHTGGTLGLERVAVGEHLLLGGDNMDIALARQVERALGDGAGKLDSVRWQSLVLQCRTAKETLLAGSAEAVTVQLAGRGRGVVAGTVHAEITRADVEGLVLDGFFPIVPSDARPRAAAGTGLREWGLPFATESEIPRHLAAFLARHHVEIGPGDAVLYNGAVFTPAALRDRITAQLATWSGGEPPLVLTSTSFDDAVARGAAYYGLVLRGEGIRVGGGSARGFYLGLGATNGPACERLLCIVPRGMQEGELVTVREPEFEVLANQPVSFQLYTSTTRSDAEPGAIVEVDRAELATLPPIRTVLRYGKKLAAQALPVHLEARRTALGTLEIWCASKASDHRWRLEFQLRDDATLLEPEVRELRASAELSTAPEQLAAAVACIADVYPPTETKQSGQGGPRIHFADRRPAEHGAKGAAHTGAEIAPRIHFADRRPAEHGAKGAAHTGAEIAPRIHFADRRPAEHGAAGAARTGAETSPLQLPRALEAALGAGRDAWSLPVIRTLWDALFAGAASRGITADHEMRWMNLCGYLLRPGFGHELDGWRIRQLSPVLAKGLQFPRAVQNRVEWWNLWKRIAGGLDRGHQLRLHGEIAPSLVPRLQKKAKVKVQTGGRPGSQEIREMWQAIGACERLDARLKSELGEVIVTDVERRRAAPQQLWALSRLGGREPLYGPLNCVVAPTIVETWITRILALPEWPAPDALAFTLVQLARVVDDRERDVDAALRERLSERVRAMAGGLRSTVLLHEAVPLDSAEQGRLLDESLPVGLRVREAASSP